MPASAGSTPRSTWPAGPRARTGRRPSRPVGHGRLAKALPDAEKAVPLAPQDYRGYLARGRIVFERGSDGLADLRKAVELSKHADAAALNAYAAALAQTGKRADAVATQREA